jgi:hypothetical protein
MLQKNLKHVIPLHSIGTIGKNIISFGLKLWFGMLCMYNLLMWYTCCNSGHVGWLVRSADIILKLHQIYSKDTSCQVWFKLAVVAVETSI